MSQSVILIALLVAVIILFFSALFGWYQKQYYQQRYLRECEDNRSTKQLLCEYEKIVNTQRKVNRELSESIERIRSEMDGEEEDGRRGRKMGCATTEEK